jgi:hypothetical protein
MFLSIMSLLLYPMEITYVQFLEMHPSRNGLHVDPGLNRVTSIKYVRGGNYVLNTEIDDDNMLYAHSLVRADNDRVVMGSHIRVFLHDKPENKYYARGAFLVASNTGTQFMLTRVQQNVPPLTEPELEQLLTAPELEQLLSEPELEQLSKPEPEPTNVAGPPPKRQRVTQSTWRETRYLGILYRSVLEARHAVFMTTLGVDFSYEPVSIHGAGTTYTPDFYLPAQNLFVEIKPCFPYIDEMVKCQNVSRKGFQIALLYGTNWTPPFARCESSGKREYRHSNAIRGMLWKNGRIVEGYVTWVGTTLTCVASTEDLPSTGDDELVRAAIETARNAMFA